MVAGRSAVVCLVSAAGCTQIFGIDDLRFEPPISAATSASASGATGGVGGQGVGGGGSGGAPPPGGTLLWSRTLSPMAGGKAFDVAIDAAGSIHLVGHSDGVLQLDVPVGQAGMGRSFVARLDAAGNPVWSHDFAGELSDGALAAAPTGGVWLAASFRNTIAVPQALPSNGGSDIFMARIDADQLTGPNSIGGAASEEGVVVAVDGAGAPHVAARFNGSFSVGTYNLANAGSWDAAVLRWDSNGMLAGATSFGGINPDVPTGLAVMGAGPLVAGWYTDTYTFGTCTTDGASDPDNFLFAFDSILTCAAGRYWGNPSTPMPVHLAALESGVAVAGHFDNGTNLLTPAVASAGSTDIYLALVTNFTNFTIGWSHVFGDASQQLVNDVAACGDRVVIVGSAAGAVDFGSGPKQGADPDAFVAAFDAAGAALWDLRWRSAAIGTRRDAVAVAVDAACSRAVVFGTFGGGIDFGSGELGAMSTDDLFVAAIAL